MKFKNLLAVFMSGILLTTALSVVAQVDVDGVGEYEFTGRINNNSETALYSLNLTAGQYILVIADPTSGNLDTVITLIDDGGHIVANNDDRNRDTYGSAFGYGVDESGTYTLEVTRYDSSTSGNFEVQITVGNDASVLDGLTLITRIQLSGPMLYRDTEHFRIHYTLEGHDAVTDESVIDAVALTAEEVWEIEINRMGWPAPPDDGFMGGDGRYDIYMIDLIGQGESAIGYASPESIVGDNPNTEAVEEYAAVSYIAIENDFADVDGGSAIALMRATFAHEFHHAIQFGYDVNDSHSWFYEATASYMETAVFLKDEDATGYVNTAYDYPELCFGTENDPSGIVMYGEWPFIEGMNELYGAQFVQDWWSNVAIYDGFETLEATFEAYDTTLPDMVAYYRLRNIARDYELGYEFNNTLWLENVIPTSGRYSFRGEGIQEMGANYFEVTAPAGQYFASITNDSNNTVLWGVGVTDSEVVAFDLGRGGNINTEGYEHYYLMAFNTDVAEDVVNCQYMRYDIDFSTPKSFELPEPTYTFDAVYFEPLG